MFEELKTWKTKKCKHKKGRAQCRYLGSLGKICYCYKKTKDKRIIDQEVKKFLEVDKTSRVDVPLGDNCPGIPRNVCFL